MKQHIDIEQSCKATVRDCLLCLDALGWSELIAPCWRWQVEDDLHTIFEDKLSEDILQKAVSTVLSPDIELEEWEYKHNDGIDLDFYEKSKQEMGIKYSFETKEDDDEQQ